MRLVINESLRLFGRLSAYVFLDTLLGIVLGFVGYGFVSILNINILVGKLFLWLMSLLGFLIGMAFAINYYKVLKSRK